MIKCTSLNCESRFSNVGSFKKHFIRKHSSKRFINKQKFDIFNEDNVISLYENAIYVGIHYERGTASHAYIVTLSKRTQQITV